MHESLDSLIVFTETESFYREAKNNLNQVRDPNAKLMLEAFIDKVAIAFGKNFDVDFRAAPTTNQSDILRNILDDPDFKYHLETRTKRASIGESRDSVFDRVLAPVLPGARKITVTDNYASDDISRPGGSWLMRRILESVNCDITILTANKKNISAMRSLVERELHSQILAASSFKSEVEVLFFHDVLHERQLQIEYLRGSTEIILGQGLATFGSARMRDNYNFCVASTPTQITTSFYQRLEQIVQSPRHGESLKIRVRS